MAAGNDWWKLAITAPDEPSFFSSSGPPSQQHGANIIIFMCNQCVVMETYQRFIILWYLRRAVAAAARYNQSTLIANIHPSMPADFFICTTTTNIHTYIIYIYINNLYTYICITFYLWVRMCEYVKRSATCQHTDQYQYTPYNSDEHLSNGLN